MKKYFILLSVMLICIIALSSCANNSKNYYYIPEVCNTFEQTSINEFEEKMNDSISKGLKYDYVGLKYQFKNPVTVQNIIELKEDYIVQKINNSYFKDRENERFWISRFMSSYNRTHESTKEYMIGDISLWNIYSVKNDAKYYKNPYSYEYEQKLDSETYSIKAVFDDNFLVESLNITSHSNDITIKMKYFNEDIPTEKGEIQKETFQDIAFVKYYKKAHNYKHMKVEINAKNIILNLTQHYDEKNDVMIMDTITGDAEVILFYNLEKIPALSDDASITSGIAAYRRVFDKIKIVNGDVGTFGESFLRSAAETYTIAYDNVFLTGIVSGNLLDIADITYKNNPLSISLKTKEAKINVEFNKFGAVSMYTYENDSSYSFQAKFTYTK